MSTNGELCYRSWRCFGAGQDLLEKDWQRRGGREQVPLALVALLGNQELRLGFGFDALGHDAQAEGEAKRNGRAAHRARLVVVADLFDEGTVDHDAVERTGAQP